MKKIILFSIFLFVAIFYGCSSPALFDVSQPTTGKIIDKIPELLKGNYYSSDTLSIISISDSIIIKTFDFNMLCHKDSLPVGYKLRADTLFIFDFGSLTEKQKVTFINDSTFMYHEYFTDTLFSMDENSVMKQWKGYYFLNEKIQIDSNKYIWDVRKLLLKNGILTLGYVENVKEIDKLNQEDTSKQQKPTFYIKPLRKSFKKFTDDNIPDVADTFYKMN